MQSETTLVLFFVIILLIAVIILGILYALHINRYSETHTFYKNLLSVIKDNAKFKAADLDEELIKSDFNIDDLSQTQKDTLTNVLNGSVSTGQYSNIADNMIDNKILSERTRLDSEPSNMFLKDSYRLYDSVYGTGLSDLGIGTGTFNFTKSSNLIKSYKTEYDNLKAIGDLFSIDGDDVTIKQLNINSNLTVSGLSICNDDSGTKNCYDFTVDDIGLNIKRHNDGSNLIKLGNDDLVIDTEKQDSYKGVFHKNTFYKINGDSYDKQIPSYSSYSIESPVSPASPIILNTFDDIAQQSKDIQKEIYHAQSSAYLRVEESAILPTHLGENIEHLNYNENTIYVYPYTRMFNFVISVTDTSSDSYKNVKITDIIKSQSGDNTYTYTVEVGDELPLATTVRNTGFNLTAPTDSKFTISSSSSTTYNSVKSITLLLTEKS